MSAPTAPNAHGSPTRDGQGHPTLDAHGGPGPSRRPRRGPANVVLVGLSGSGKTTVGRLLARRLGWRFVDTDQQIQQRTGQTVQEIFRVQGEPAFRAIESAVVAEVCQGARQVIATGGGAVVAEANRQQLLDGNLVVYLASAPDVLAARLSRSLSREPRPLLQDRDLVERLAELAAQREPHYRCAHHVVSTDQRTPREVVDVIAELVRTRL